MQMKNHLNSPITKVSKKRRFDVNSIKKKKKGQKKWHINGGATSTGQMDIEIITCTTVEIKTTILQQTKSRTSRIIPSHQCKYSALFINYCF